MIYSVHMLRSSICGIGRIRTRYEISNKMLQTAYISNVHKFYGQRGKGTPGCIDVHIIIVNAISLL